MIKAGEFARRRRQLMRMIGRDAIAIVPSAPERVRSNDAHYPVPPGQRPALPERLPRAGRGARADSRAQARRADPVLPRARSRARAVGRPARRHRGRGRAIRHGRRDSRPPTSTTSCRA
jgi:hypothetical protein